ncbi:hypothetical protein IAR55_007051 [Kwoniella newhampshirensis]|uniref:Calcineurin-like phosphoesterase domain-containing protein n=1 Tax=Kwoniella newhampshirensis TaxID=1651941 RepID=A0AAW0YDF9_9TREE
MHLSPNSRSPVLNNGLANGGPGRGRKSGLRARGTQLLALRFGWVVLVIWFEVGDFFHSLSTCRFPDSVLRRSHPSLSAPPTHVVLLADTHVPHPRLSYAPDSRPWVNWLKQQMDELFMRKSWNVVMRLGRVDAVIVVGDMLDWGRGVMSDEEYEEYYNSFKSIFQLPPNVPMHFVPGNHDIPLGPNKMFSPHSRDRYAQHFSPPNAILPIANHSLIMLDAVGLVEEDYRRYAAEMQFGEWDGVEGGVIEFVKDLGDEPPPAPRILISHIPLARPEASTCGPLRERGRISKGAGPGYQNLLGSETSKFLLEALQPSIVFSGDDHDYCEHTHPNGIREVTIKSFSSSTGIRRPGFQLLSLVPPQPNAYAASLTHADRPCFLPDQLGVYSRVYIPLAIITTLYLLGTNIRAAYQRWNAAGHSVYGDLKNRLSPALVSTEIIPSSATLLSRRGVSDRPVPLTLPSRKSSQQLAGMTSISTGVTTSMPRPMRYNSEQLTPNRSSSVSAPVSPFGSPRASFSEEKPAGGYIQSSLGRTDEDIESGPSYRETYTSSPTPPNMSRRSSFIYMNDHRGESNGDSGLLTAANGAAGLGLTTPQGTHFPFGTGSNQTLRRVSSSNLTALNGMSLNSPGLGSSAPHPVRRVTMPRALTNSDWSSAASKKERSMYNYVVDALPASGGRRGVWKKGKAFARWLWKSRNGVVGKSWREVLAVAWPAGVVWLIVNALFFLE